MRFEIGEWKLQRRGNARRRGEMNDERRREFVEDAGDARGVTQVVELERIEQRRLAIGVAASDPDEAPARFAKRARGMTGEKSAGAGDQNGSFLTHAASRIWCLRPDSNRHFAFAKADFKSAASTNSATEAAPMITVVIQI